MSVGLWSWRLSSCYSIDMEVNRWCLILIEFFDCCESVIFECDILLIFKIVLYVVIYNNLIEVVKLLLRCNIDFNFFNVNLISYIKVGCYVIDVLKINILKFFV